jgi:hypothetical protein
VKIGVNPWRNSLGAIAAGLVVVFFCLILLWHDPLIFWNDDYQISILPVFADVARSWNEWHFPLLSPYSWVCGNLAGEFEYGTFSIFVNAAVVLIWKFPLTFSQQAAALSITHLFVLAAGAFLLARDRLALGEGSSLTQRLSRPPLPQGEGGGEGSLNISSTPLSIFVALVATLNGWIICWGATDWFGALGAFAWLPWAWWGLERALDPQRTRYRFLWPAPFVYLLVTGGFPYTVLMLLLLVAWLACRAVASSGGGSIKSLVETRNFMSILPMLFGVALGFGLSAPAWLAVLDYVHGSAREMQPASAHFQWLVPLAALPGFILPCWTVNWANFYTRMMPHTATEMACGLVAPIAILTALINRGRAFVRQMRWELLLLLLVLLLSMLPTAGVFRWSFRWLPFFHLVLAVCAAEALRTNERRGIIALLLVGVIAITMSMLRVDGAYAFPLTWILLGLAGLWAFSEFFSIDFKLRDWTPVCITLAALLATYLCIPPNGSVPKFNLSQQLLEPAPLDPERLYLSVYPPPEFDYRVEKKPGPVGQIVRPGSTSMWAHLRFINGYSPISPAGVARAFHVGTHGEIDPDVANHLLKEQSGADGKLAQLGVDGIVIAREIKGDPQPASEWTQVFSNDEGRVFNRRGPPFVRARSIAAFDLVTGEQFSAAAIAGFEESRNRVQVDLDVPSGERSVLLIFSRPYFRGYQAHMNSTKLVVESADGLFSVVRIPPGASGRLVLEYRPAWLVAGATVAFTCLTILIVGFVAGVRAKMG